MDENILRKLFKKIEAIEYKIAHLEEKKAKKNKVLTYKFSTIKYRTLKKLVKIKEKFPLNEFTDWFNYQYEFKKEMLIFFEELIEENKLFIRRYSEDDLKSNFIIPFLNEVKFKDINTETCGFYHGGLTYKTKQFILNGYCDFYVAKGLFSPEKSYFFIQEFKQDKYASHPEPQLIAELISAVELNDFSSIRGAYIIGNIWRFVILKKLAKHNYQFFVSQNFDCMRLEEIKAIYKHLLFVKDEIIKMVKEEKICK